MLTDKMKRMLRKHCRHNPKARIAGIHFTINMRHALAMQLDALEGRVAWYSDGTDCDHVRSIVAWEVGKPSLLEAWRKIEHEYEYAEGPTSCGFINLSDAPENSWRDYGSEAHENGHPHSIHMGA